MINVQRNRIWMTHVALVCGAILTYASSAAPQPDSALWMDGGAWIGASVERSGLAATDVPVWLFRNTFTLDEVPSRVMATLATAGISELWINGRKVGDAVLEPAVMDLRKSVPYRVHEVTHLLQPGRNVVGVKLGGGFVDLPTSVKGNRWRAAPFAMSPRFWLELRRVDASRPVGLVWSGPDWEMTPSDITFHCMFGGEFMDARRRIPDWSESGGGMDIEWRPAVVLPAPSGEPYALSMPPVRVTEDIHPVSLDEPEPGVYVWDMGVNFTGWVRFEGRGAAGHTARIFISERRRADGTIDKTASNPVQGFEPFHEVRVTFSGAGRETFEPGFSFQSGQYVQIEGLDYPPAKEDLTGRAVHNDFTPVGRFESSSETINRLLQGTLRVIRNNWIGVQFDCPHREKSAWLGDYTRVMTATMYCFDMAESCRKVVRDILDNQEPEGGIMFTVPTRSLASTDLIDVWWQGDIWRIPWLHYLFYGDGTVLEETFPAMVQFMEFMLARHPYGFIEVRERPFSPPYGDHCSVGYFEERDAYVQAIAAGVDRAEAANLFRTPHHLLAAMGTYDGAMTIARIAGILGETAKQAHYAGLAERVRDRINAVLERETGAYADDSQTLQALALYYEICPPEDRDKVYAYLLHNIQEVRGGHLSTGTIATRKLFRVLSAMGDGALAVRMIEQPGAPGFRHMLDQGVTAIWERWDGRASLNHPALGCIVDWFYADLAGIRPDPAMPGFRRILFHPDVDSGLEFVRAEYDSAAGTIGSEWEHREGRLTVSVRVPKGAEGIVRLPCPVGTTIMAPPDARERVGAEGQVEYLVGPGLWTFHRLAKDSQEAGWDSSRPL